MSCTPKIQKLGNAPQGGKLKADFNVSPQPEWAEVVRTDSVVDKQKVNPAGNWISKEKYQSTAQTLRLYDANNNVICDCKYDANGDIVIASEPKFVTNGMLFDKSTGTLNVTVLFSTENSMASYILQRKVPFDTYQDATTFNYDVSKGGAYDVVDANAPAGSLVYRVVGNTSATPSTQLVDTVEYPCDNS